MWWYCNEFNYTEKRDEIIIKTDDKDEDEKNDFDRLIGLY